MRRGGQYQDGAEIGKLQRAVGHFQPDTNARDRLPQRCGVNGRVVYGQ